MMHSWTRNAALTLSAVGLTVAALAGCARTTTTASAPTSAGGSSAASPGASADEQLPANWPSDVPVPPLPVKHAVAVNLPSGPSFSAVFRGQGQPGALLASMNEQFAKAGFTSQSSFGSGPAGGVAVWHKGNETVQLTVATEDGQLTVSENVMITASKS